jgi:hypothetical protein
MKIRNFQRSVKGKVNCPEAHHECILRSGGIAPPIFNLNKHVGGVGSFMTWLLTLEETASDTYGIGGWVVPKTGLDTLV